MFTPIVLVNSEGWPGIVPGKDLLNSGHEALDVVEGIIKPTESEQRVRTVGFGSPPNAEGVMQLDASIMDGNTLETGAVGAIENIMHPISVAREVMIRLPHVMLVGAGARRFALECGFPSENILSDDASKNYQIWKEKNYKQNLIEVFHNDYSGGCHGTVISLVIDKRGNFAGGVSTSGWDYKYPGRLGDSPVIGAGMYVDRRYGGAACTHCGENAIRTVLARSVVLYMKKGASVKEAVAEGMDDLRALKGGIQGQVTIYAFDNRGDYFVARRFKDKGKCRYLVYRDGMTDHVDAEAEWLG